MLYKPKRSYIYKSQLKQVLQVCHLLYKPKRRYSSQLKQVVLVCHEDPKICCSTLPLGSLWLLWTDSHWALRLLSKNGVMVLHFCCCYLHLCQALCACASKWVCVCVRECVCVWCVCGVCRCPHMCITLVFTVSLVLTILQHQWAVLNYLTFSSELILLLFLILFFHQTGAKQELTH